MATPEPHTPGGRLRIFVNGTRHHAAVFTLGIARGGQAEAAITLADLRAVADQLDLDRERLAAATARAEKAEARLSIQVGNVHELATELEQLRAQHAELGEEWRFDDGAGKFIVSRLKLSPDDVRHLQETTGREVEHRYVSPWRPLADAPATALSATETAPEATQVLADDRTDVRVATEPTEAEPCPSCRETYCDDGRGPT